MADEVTTTGEEPQGEVHVLDDGRHISMCFGEEAREIVAESRDEAVVALATMLFEEHTRTQKLEALLACYEADPKHPEPPVVKGALDVQETAEKKAAAEQRRADALAAARDGFLGALENLVCPFTGAKFFMVIEHEGKPLATFGGPYDSYTLPERAAEGSYHRLRYCHDRGHWIEWESLGADIVTEEKWCELLEQLSNVPSYDSIVQAWLDRNFEQPTTQDGEGDNGDGEHITDDAD